MIQSSGVEPPVSGFQSQPLTVASRLLHPHNTESSRLIVKQLFIARNTEKDSYSYMEMRRRRKVIEVTRRRKGRVKSEDSNQASN